ncbi:MULTISPECIES: lytic murein transglycosylase [unclassified Rhizobium]|uniref:lytic murein transglycosylase n=1 Tax=unclassified Rhizobium TaxID=2613769 RepID=UPI0010478DB8|nr:MULTISPECIES: lytic murein transglycosylase [unclassified Rhizobium]MBB3395227.1 membrane-bound lytic murein transglycosylase B [Rhizobium sp. BK060]MBB4167183.1 membrane-bound lytic murein transglycosylase B [Rhizobium sp. BK538]TCM77965.1 membrane-bound lytic murein transglycosylase B [Rhizobium sp. BK068]
MTQNHRNSLRGLAIAFVVTASAGLAPINAKADQQFQKWIADFYQTAAQNGISKATYRKAFAGVSDPDPTVLEKAAYQPEFTTKIWDYVDSRVNPYTVQIGRQMAAKHGATLNAIERRFGVDKSILLAIWSMESNYGAVLDKDDRLHYVPRALATLAYADERRAKFAKKQLIAALKILQNGDISPNGMTGSWAGAMGHTQFIPTSYLLYAIDADGNGHRDIWNSVPDALATSANLLMKNGWDRGKTWGYEVVVPASARKQVGKTHTLAQWASLGLTRPNGKGFRDGGGNAVLKMPAGPNGPGFLMTSNFFTIKRYNASDSYAIGVGLLADELAGYGGMKQRWPRPDGTLDMKEKFELQTRLKTLGYYDGEVDGNFGSGSKAAIAAVQARMGMQQDGEPSLPLLNALRK